MRVSIKRLRLLYRFLDFFSDNQFCAKKKAKLLVDVFKSAGPLRDAQIQLSILEKLKENIQSDYSKLNKYLRKKEKSGMQNLKDKTNTFDTKKINHLLGFSEALLKIISDFPGLQASFDNYKKNRLVKINNLLKIKNQKVEFHKVRKRIKDLTYLTEIQQIQSEKANNELVLLKLLGRKLGDWHDIEVFLNELSLTKSEKKKTEEDFNKIKVKLKQQQQVIIDEFYVNFQKIS